MTTARNDPTYEAVLERAQVHLHRAWDAFCEDEAINWRARSGDVPKVRAQVWVDALKAMLAHAEGIERHLNRSS